MKDYSTWNPSVSTVYRQKHSKKITLRIPSSINEANIDPAIREHALWLVARLANGALYSYQSGEKWIRLSNELLTSYIPYMKLHPVKEALSGLGILDIDNSYCPLGFAGRPGESKGFRLTDPVTQATQFKSVFVSGKVLSKKILNDRKIIVGRGTKPLIGVYHDLAKWVDAVELAPAAPGVKDNEQTLRILKGERFALNDRNGRFNTCVSLLPKIHRHRLRMPGFDSLHMVDVSCCQPLTVGIVFREELKRTSYLDDCVKGVIYDRISQKMGVDRAEAKERFLKYINCDSRDQSAVTTRAVGKLYPGLAPVIGRFHLRYGIGALARKSIGIESRVMLSISSARFMKTYRDKPILTIHDAVIVPEDKVPAVRSIVSNSWFHECGVSPSLKTSETL